MAKRRGHGEGSVYRLPSGKWRGRVSVSGRRLSKTARTQREILDWIKSINVQVERGLTYDRAQVTLGEYLISWLASKQKAVRPATYNHYEILVNKYLVPALGDIPVKDLTPDRLQHAYDQWILDEIGVPTALKAHSVLHHALARAEKTGLVIRNVADLVDPPAQPDKEMLFWTPEEANQFLTTALANRLYALFYLAIVTGARQMEILGLQWKDVDWIQCKLRIARQLARKNGDTFAPLKTDAAKRTLAIGEKAVAVLKEHQARQDLERQFAGRRWQEHGLIFTSLLGTPVHYKNLMDRYYYPLVERAGVQKIRFHDLRHTAASLMLSQGKSIWLVSKILGHSSVNVTDQTYGHLVPHGAQEGIIAMMDDLVAPVAIELIGHELATD
jgi:integrase